MFQLIVIIAFVFLGALYVVNVIQIGSLRGEVSLSRGRNRTMANEIANLNAAVADVSTKLDAATTRVAALEAAQANTISGADVDAATAGVVALGPKIDALAASLAPSS